ncbi:hypothetical protein F8388_024740 [Cannabis sativa]|uniref:Sulfotransferase n=1 Tax=Cannabis sativa TaxID=3483 RepID=A0A7J6GCD7_CANSA|nr:hypothetical protein F8388_024740 [Cannabis sativa]
MTENINNDKVAIISELPKSISWLKDGVTLYQNCWFPTDDLPSVVSFQKQFKAKDEDIILASFPKTGTTWLKSLLFSILNRNKHHIMDNDQHPLLTTNPHHLVSSLEHNIYAHHKPYDLATMSSPRLISTHIPYASLNNSIKYDSKSRIVYITRNPLDAIVSTWHFSTNGHPGGHSQHEWGMEECVDMFCRGEACFGPFWDHALGYWKVKANGVVEKILELCSFDKLKNLDVNKHGQLWPKCDNKSFFRKGQVGDWANHLSPSMVERVNKIMKEKFNGSGLSFRMS